MQACLILGPALQMAARFTLSIATKVGSLHLGQTVTVACLLCLHTLWSTLAACKMHFNMNLLSVMDFSIGVFRLPSWMFEYLTSR